MQEPNKNIEVVGLDLKLQEDRGDAISIKGLTKRYEDGKLAVDNIDFTLYQGNIFALLGPNGAGKTTAIQMLCGMLRAT